MTNTRSSEIAEAVDRSWPRERADDELRLGWEFLNFLRITAVNKVAGLTREQAAATPFPASPHMNALGVLKHLTAVERWWFSIVAGGLDIPDLWLDADDHDALFKLRDEDTPTAVVAAYRAEWPRSQEAIAGMAASDRVRRAGEDKTVRWILTHLIQETARHVGHLDVLREFADGQVGE
ncbi:DinB family protein [Amycolatopsis anabasis]|uniref:DinB family protein n=1 Tax=Amycolatopsis anabasis TaxID=1840409 RepID=UPI00131E7472|nr:DinB family protein [Amycolatopsis anabasis]